MIGEGGIRTLGSLSTTLVFKTSTFVHSVTSPGNHNIFLTCLYINKIEGFMEPLSPYLLWQND